MTSTSDILTHLRRPRLLITAARFGLAEYDRNPRTFTASFATEDAGPRSRRSRGSSMRKQASRKQRRAGAATYLGPHAIIDVLIALMGGGPTFLTPSGRGIRSGEGVGHARLATRHVLFQRIRRCRRPERRCAIVAQELLHSGRGEARRCPRRAFPSAQVSKVL